MAAVPAPAGASERRDGRRRVGALLNAYYHIEGGEPAGEAAASSATVSDLDRQGFDAKRYFDSMVASGQLPDLVKRAKDLDSEVKELDGEMQGLVYENYTKFTKAAWVIKQMKFCIEGLEPDIKRLEGHNDRVSSLQQHVEEGIGARSTQIESLLKRQRVCKKLQVLFGLPATLQRCLDAQDYGHAVEAYCNCAGFLRQYRNMPTFQKVLEEVDEQMGRIRSALEQRLLSPDLSVDEAVNSSVTLLDLNEDQEKVATKYLSGRAAVLQQSLERCFGAEALSAATAAAASAAPPAEGEEASRLSKDQLELQRPESVALRAVCSSATELYVPHLCDAVEGFQKLQEGRPSTGPGEASSQEEGALHDFVSARIEELCERISGLVEQRCPPTRVLVSCVHAVRDSLRRLHSLLPRLLNRLFMAFLSRTANNAMKALFLTAASSVGAGLLALHGECKKLQESKNSGLDDVLEEIAKTEQALIMSSFAALTDCQPLLSLLGSDKVASQQLVRGLHAQLSMLFLTFAEACRAYIGHDPLEARAFDPTLPGMPRATAAEVQEISTLEWSGLFGLALVRIGRHLEVKAINKVWGVAKDLFADTAAAAELVPPPAVIKATRLSAQAVITHYAFASGQRLAHFFRNSVQSRNWMTAKEPRDPRPITEMVLREVHAFDAQLARILGDPRKPKEGQRRPPRLSTGKTEMELDLERLWAKKLPVFAPIPFNRNGTIVGILRIAFKALYEYMREETFAKFGLQQIQVDCAFLAEVVRDFVEAEDASVLDSLLDEVVTSAAQRCDDPTLMDNSIVEALCDEKKKKGFRFD